MTELIFTSAILAAEDNSNAQTLVLIGFGILFITLLLWRNKSKHKNVEKISSVHSQRHKIRNESIMRDEANSLMLKLAELSREICGQIDTRYAKLEHAIMEADRKIEQLEKISQLLARQTATTGDVDDAPPVLQQKGEAVNPTHEKIYRMHTEGLSNTEIAKQLDMPTGEVELIVSLQRKRDENPTNAEEIAPEEIPADRAEQNKPPQQNTGGNFDARA